MTHEVKGIVFLLAAVGTESFAQLFLKIGSNGSGKRHWILFGVVAYLLEICLYTFALLFLDVSVAYPLGSLCFVGVALLSRIFLGETVTLGRWIGVGFIVAGTIVVAL